MRALTSPDVTVEASFTRSRQEWSLDLLGLGAAVVLVGWGFFVASKAGGDPWPLGFLVLACAAVVVATRLIASVARWIVPTSLCLCALVLFAFFPTEILSGSPRGGPFGLRSITAAFFVQAGIGALMLVPRTKLLTRVMCLVIASGFTSLGLLHGMRATAIIVFLAAPACVAAAMSKRRRWPIVALAALFIGALSWTVLIGGLLNGSEGGPGGVVNRELSVQRVAFWHEGVRMILDHPITGVGPGNFEQFSLVLLPDRSGIWAHSDFLQLGGELGVPGIALLVGLFTWGFARLYIARSPKAFVVLGSASLAAVGILACVGHILFQPTVPIVAAALLGTAVGPFKHRRSGDANDGWN